MPKKMASEWEPGKKYLRERGRKARQNFYLIQGEQSWFNFFPRPFFFGFFIFVFFLSFFLFVFFFGGGGVISIILGYNGGKGRLTKFLMKRGVIISYGSGNGP